MADNRKETYNNFSKVPSGRPNDSKCAARHLQENPHRAQSCTGIQYFAVLHSYSDADAIGGPNMGGPTLCTVDPVQSVQKIQHFVGLGLPHIWQIISS